MWEKHEALPKALRQRSSKKWPRACQHRLHWAPDWAAEMLPRRCSKQTALVGQMLEQLLLPSSPTLQQETQQLSNKQHLTKNSTGVVYGVSRWFVSCFEAVVAKQCTPGATHCSTSVWQEFQWLVHWLGCFCTLNDHGHLNQSLVFFCLSVHQFAQSGQWRCIVTSESTQQLTQMHCESVEAATWDAHMHSPMLCGICHVWQICVVVFVKAHPADHGILHLVKCLSGKQNLGGAQKDDLHSGQWALLWSCNFHLVGNDLNDQQSPQKCLWNTRERVHSPSNMKSLSFKVDAMSQNPRKFWSCIGLHWMPNCVHWVNVLQLQISIPVLPSKILTWLNSWSQENGKFCLKVFGMHAEKTSQSWTQ